MATLTLNYKELSISERIQLVEDIWDSIAEETSNDMHILPEEYKELEYRLAAHQAEPASSISWEQVRVALFNE